MRVINVVIVDDHKMVRQGLKSFFSVYDSLNLLADVSGGRELFKLNCLDNTDIILMDLVMPDIDGVELTKIVMEKYPKIKIISLTSFSDIKLHRKALKSGSKGILHKDISADDLKSKILSVYRGHPIIDYQIFNDENEELPLEKLSEREKEILNLLARGLSNSAIGTTLHISRSTVKYHLGNMFLKLNASTRAEAVSIAYENDLITT